MNEFATGFVERAGYLGVALLTLLEVVFPPIPSEVIVPFVGYLAASGRLSLPAVIAAATAGALLGALALYGVGRAVGRARVRRFIERHGRWLTVSPDELERAERFFRRHGTMAVLLGRIIPGLRSIVSLPAGIEAMPLPRFSIVTAIGTAAWTSLLAVAGYLLGETYGAVGKWVDVVLYAVLGTAAVAYVVRLLRHPRRQRAQPERAVPSA